jgi:dTDP-4-amino-4,6-dideoxygalactose transaminase
MIIPIIKPEIGDEEITAISRVINSGWVTQGPEIAEFEREFCNYVGSEHAIAVSSCTSALHLALKVIGVKEKHEVITVSNSFIATANCIRYCGAIPVFIDIDSKTGNMNPELIEEVISEKTKAILCVHQAGIPCDLENILKIGKKHSIPIIEDAACAVGSEIKIRGVWEKVGKPHGDIACFSFHPRKLLTTGDGGMLTTSDPEIAQKLKLLRHHGMSVSDVNRHNSTSVQFESYTELGYNYRMTDIQAAMGRVQLKRLPEIINKRKVLAERYIELFKNCKEITTPDLPYYVKPNWQSFWIRFLCKVNQMDLMQYLLDKGISTRRGIMCSHLEPAYTLEEWNTGKGKQELYKLFEGEKLQNESIILPLYSDLTKSDQMFIVDSIKNFL